MRLSVEEKSPHTAFVPPFRVVKLTGLQFHIGQFHVP